MRLLTILAAIFTLSALQLAHAQSIPTAPVHSMVDARGVDLLSGTFSPTDPTVSIGLLSDGIAPTITSDYLSGNNVDTFAGNLVYSYDQAQITVTALGRSETFQAIPPNNYYANLPTGNLLTRDSQYFNYTLKDGTLIRFIGVNPFSGPWNQQHAVHETRIVDITRPDGHVITISGYGAGDGSPSYVESSLGYGVVGGAHTAANLKLGGCTPTTTAATCTGPTIQSYQALHLARTYSPGTATTGAGRTTTYTGASNYLYQTVTTDGPQTYQPIASATTAAGTWTYSYTQAAVGTLPVAAEGILTTTVTDPLGHHRIVRSEYPSRLILSDQTEAGTTTYGYANQSSSSLNYGPVTSITNPEGDKVLYTYSSDGRYNITEERHQAKPNSGLADLVFTASYPSSCTNPKTCNKPDWVMDAKANAEHPGDLNYSTQFTYDPTHGGVLTTTGPAGASGVRPQTRYTYGQFTAKYYRSGGAMAAGPPVWRLTQTSTCATGVAPACLNTADETVTTIAYEASSSANNVRPLSVTVAAGDGSVAAATTKTTYDAPGNVVSVDGPLSGTADTTTSFYDAGRRRTGEIGPDPDGAGALLYRASRTTYDNDSLVTKVETGTATSQSSMSSFATLKQLVTAYDNAGRKVSDAISGSASASLSQYSYDTADRLVCTAVRMNAATFGAPPAGACSVTAAGIPTALPGTQGSFGPDRITMQGYDIADRVTSVVEGFGIPADVATTVAISYGSDGEVTSRTDADNNKTTYEYDGFLRLLKTDMPSLARDGTSSTTDYEQYGYDANGNKTLERRRNGVTVNYTYDAMNRKLSGYAGSTFTYDLLGRMKTATLGSQTLTFGYDALSRKTSEAGPLGTVAYQYDAAGRRTRITWPNTAYIAYGYDTVGEMTTLGDGVYTLATYSYDNLGRRAGISRYNGVTSAYSYGTDLRLSSLGLTFPSTGAQTWTYNYNPADQVTSQTSSRSDFDWASPYNTSKPYGVTGQNRYSTLAGVALSYGDSLGNLTNDGTTAYVYDDLNKLKTAGTATLTYDALDRLVQTVGSSTTKFQYDGDQIIAEYDSSNALLRRYVAGDGVNEPVVWYEGTGLANRQWLISDRQGSIVGVTTQPGALSNINTYDEYGVSASANIGRFRYDGAPWVPEIGLYHLQARVYSPTLGRFMQTDPVQYQGGPNWYAYGGDDPVNRSDPSGLLTYFAGGSLEGSTDDGDPPQRVPGHPAPIGDNFPPPETPPEPELPSVPVPLGPFGLAAAAVTMLGSFAPHPALEQANRIEEKVANTVRDHMKPMDLSGARAELAGHTVATKSNGVPWDHINEVREAQNSLMNQIGFTNRMMSNPNTPAFVRPQLQRILSTASKWLDYSERYVPRR